MSKRIHLHMNARKIVAKVATLTDSRNELVTVPNVPMVSTGIDYPTSTGNVTLTEQHLMDIIASQDDPAIHAPRTKIGHSDPRFNTQFQADGTVLDGEPSLGSWLNLRLGNNNQTLYGDIVGVPRWLANILATAYPSRSIEGNFDVETVTGHKWSLALESVALLGVIGPGITTLEDLPILFSQDGPEGVRVVEPKEGDVMSVKASTIRAQVNLDDLRRDYYESLDPAQFWWWIRAIYIDPGELIVDDDEGGLYRVAFDASGDKVTFEDPQAVQIQYVDKPKTAASASLRAALSKALGGQRILATYNVRAESRQGEKSMNQAQIAVLRNRLGLTSDQLPDDADDATVLRVLDGVEEPQKDPDTPVTPPEQPPTAPENPVQNPPATPGQPTNPPAPQNPPEAPNIPQGYQIIDEETLNQLREGADAGLAVARQQQVSDRDHFLDDAVRAGKFPPSRREHYVLMWSGKDGKGGDPEGTKAFIDALAPGLVPVEARGTARSAESGLDASSDYPQDWLSPSERSRLEAAANGDNGNYGSRRLVIHGGD